MFVQSLAEDLERCGRSLSDLDAAVQEFGRRNPLLAKQLSDAISKLSEMHHHSTRLADCRSNWLKKVMALFASPTSMPHHEKKGGFNVLILALQAVCYLDEYNEMLDFIVRWSEKAKSLVRANIIWNSSAHLQEQIRLYQVTQMKRTGPSAPPHSPPPAY